MEVIENKEKYLRRETSWQKGLRLLRKFIWLFPLLAIALGLLIAWQLIRSIQAESTRLPEVHYEDYLEPEQKKEKELKKLELYREKMKKEKEQQITSRYDRIISGSDIVGKVDYGKVIPPPDQDLNLPAESKAQQAGQEEVINPPPVPDRTSKTSGSKTVKKGKEKKDQAAETSDSLSKPAPDPFHTVKPSGAESTRYTRAYFHGEQDILNGAFIRLRLGEDMLVQGKLIPRNTIFRGLASLSQNKIEIRVEQIGSQETKASICDGDYNPGILIPAAKREGMDDALNRSLYQTGSGSAMDLPYEILQDVTQNIIRNKRRKQATIRINDGYLVYLTQTTD